MKLSWHDIAKRFNADPESGEQVVRCPAHEDSTASLSITYRDGRVLLNCHAGCDTQVVADAVKLSMSDLFPGTEGQSSSTRRIVATYDYRDEQGKLLYQKLRYEPKEFSQRVPKDGGGWEYKLNGVQRVLYRLPQLVAADRFEPVHLPEGEKDSDNLAQLGLVTTTNAEGASKNERASKWLPEYTRALAGRVVVLYSDNDDSGRSRVRSIAAALTGVAESVRVVDLPNLPPKGDVSDWIAAQRAAGLSNADIRTALEAIVAQTPEWDSAIPPTEPTAVDPPAAKVVGIASVPIGQWCSTFVKMREPRIHGLLRQGEVGSIIAAPKVGKSWLSSALALSGGFGLDWIGFPVEPGSVLLIDNELHPETIASRLSWLAEKRGLDIAEANIEAISLRGQSLDLKTLEPTIALNAPKKFSYIILDAWYRLIPQGMDENSNSDMTVLFNLLDKYAQMTGATILAVHHTSKGVQGNKSVTDVGAGAGAQSRAVDAHLVIREHEQEGAFVIDAACRSFAQPASFCVRRDFPLWERADDLDPKDIKQERHGRTRGDRKPTEKPAKSIVAWTAKLFAEQFIVDEPRETKVIESYARAEKVPVRNIPAFLDQIRREGLAHYQEGSGRRPDRYSRKPFPAQQELSHE